MNEKGFLPCREWDEEVGNCLVTTVGGELWEKSDYPVSLHQCVLLHLCQTLTHNQGLLFL